MPHIPEKKFFAAVVGTAAILCVALKHPTDGVCEGAIASLVSLWLGLLATQHLGERKK